MPGEGSQEDKDKEKIHSAQLKVYWKPKLSIVRSHGCFKARTYDMIKSEINSLLDIKKINHKDASLDEGKLNEEYIARDKLFTSYTPEKIKLFSRIIFCADRLVHV